MLFGVWDSFLVGRILFLGQCGLRLGVYRFEVWGSGVQSFLDRAAQ